MRSLSRPARGLFALAVVLVGGDWTETGMAARGVVACCAAKRGCQNIGRDRAGVSIPIPSHGPSFMGCLPLASPKPLCWRARPRLAVGTLGTYAGSIVPVPPNKGADCFGRFRCCHGEDGDRGDRQAGGGSMGGLGRPGEGKLQIRFKVSPPVNFLLPTIKATD